MQSDDNQLKAIRYQTGPVLVNAGPGAGKTYVLTHRISYLISQNLAAEEEILVITFTTAAASLMKSRYLSIMEEEFTSITFSTFHSFFYSIIKKYRKFDKISIITTEQKIRMIQEIMDQLHLEQPDVMKSTEILSEISYCKTDTTIDKDDYQSKTMNTRDFYHVYYEYQHKLKYCHLVDFDDMICECYQIVKKDEAFCNQLRQRFKFILIDEFQDINAMQYNIILTIFKKDANLFAVGDEDQAIYGFRGSTPKLMFQFLEDYRNVKQIGLYKNYRCASQIVDASVKLISQNKMRFSKEIVGCQKEGLLSVLDFPDAQKEYEMIQNRLNEMKEKRMLSTCAVLFRTNADAEFFCEKLRISKIPYQMKEKSVPLYVHFIVKDIMAYLLFSKGERSRTHFIRIMNRPNRYIKRSILTDDVIDLSMLKKNRLLSDDVRKSLVKLEKDLNMMKELDPYAAINYLFHSVRYSEFLCEEAKRNQKHYKDYLEVFEEIKTQASMFDTINDFSEYILEYQFNQGRTPDIEDKVSVMSMHSAKGLEWDNVFLPKCNEGKIPHPLSETEEEMEEERRVFYVAMTRAKSNLILSYIQDNKRYVKSRFLPKKQTGI